MQRSLRRWWYLAVQARQSLGKRRKDASFRLVPAIEAVIRVAGPSLDARVRILCVGARNGIEPQLWRDRGYSAVEAIDIIPAKGVRLMDFHRLRHEDGAFGLVFASHAYEHALDPGQAVAEAVRVLRPGGWLYAAFPVGFETNAHDRWDYGDHRGFLRYLPAGTRLMDYRVWGGKTECNVLVRIA